MLVDSREECASAVRSLLQNPGLARELAAKGKDRVRHNFLLPRLLINELSLMKTLAERPKITAHEPWGLRRDPVCGMIMTGDHLTVDRGARVFHFCSEQCKARFLLNPDKFLRISTYD